MKARVRDTHGRVVRRLELIHSHERISVIDLAPGYYVLELQDPPSVRMLSFVIDRS